jgi:acetate kinase
MRVLVLNCGSATVKYQVFDPSQRVPLASGALPAGAVRQAVEEALAKAPRIDAAGHRLVHGGERFLAPVRIDGGILAEIESLEQLAPLHNPASVRGIRCAQERLGPQTPQVAVFDTSFHATMPPYAAHYAVPLAWRSAHGVRRYGFHGLSHRWVAERYAELAGLPLRQVDLVSLHLGNGCSACAIRGGRSMDTSMGFTPLEGLMMGTRSGDLDPAVVPFLADRMAVPEKEVLRLLNAEAGLLGVSGLSHDVRVLMERQHQDARAALAIEMFCYRARKYIGAYLAALGGARAIAFTGGIGERSAEIRARICSGLECLGVELDAGANAALAGAEGPVHARGARLEVWVIPANEEWIIARDTVACLTRGRMEEMTES